MQTTDSSEETTQVYKDDMRTSLLGSSVRRMRLRREWTIEYLAEKSGVDPDIIFHLEIGLTRITEKDNIDALARAFDFPPELLNNLSQRSERPASPEVTRALQQVMPLEITHFPRSIKVEYASEL